MSDLINSRIERRAAIKWMLAASATMTLSRRQLLGATPEP